MGPIMHSRLSFGLSLAASLMLVACGGASNGGSAPAPTPPSPPSSAPTITLQPSDQTVSVGQTATFAVAASGGGTLSYQWQRGESPIAGATEPCYTTAWRRAVQTGSSCAVARPHAGRYTSSR